MLSTKTPRVIKGLYVAYVPLLATSMFTADIANQSPHLSHWALKSFLAQGRCEPAAIYNRLRWTQEQPQFAHTLLSPPRQVPYPGQLWA